MKDKMVARSRYFASFTMSRSFSCKRTPKPWNRWSFSPRVTVSSAFHVFPSNVPPYNASFPATRFFERFSRVAILFLSFSFFRSLLSFFGLVWRSRFDRYTFHGGLKLTLRDSGQCKNVLEEKDEEDSPVTGASISIMVFSERRRAAPSLTIRRAAASSILPSRIKCCLRTSGRGRSVRGSNTSATVNLCDGGKGTSVNKNNKF